ncbi:MAG: hypothetical protein ACRD5H_13195, partial [Nitrososphaerales archaeon]
SVKAGIDVGVDFGISKNSANKRITTYTGSLGIGGVVTPYAVPAEMHGGLAYTTAVSKVNLTQTFTNAANMARAGGQAAYSSFQGQISKIQSQLKDIQQKLNQLSKSQNNSKTSK